MNAEVACEHGAVCAGCTRLGAPYESQLAEKAERLERSLRRHPALRRVAVSPARPADPLVGYRTRVKWMVGPHGELGLYSRGASHEVVDVPGCRVVAEPVAAAGAALRRLLARGGVEGLDRLRAVDLRALRDDDTRVWATLVFARGDTPTKRALHSIAETLRREARVSAVFLNEVDPRSIQVLGAKTETLVGEAEGWDRIAGVRLLAAPGSFVQAHATQAAAIADAIRARVRAHAEQGRRPRVLDLFAGSGTWGLAAAAEGAEVLAVESYAPAASRIARAARAAGHAVVSRAEDAEAAARALARDGERFDLVVVNPPRRGVGPALRDAVAALAPREVVYVSCDPDTLARDLADFVRLGLSPSRVLPIDMIPLTDHVEALALLEPAPPPAPREVATDGSLSLFDKPPHESIDALLQRLAPGGASHERRGVGPEALASGLVAVANRDDAEASRATKEARARLVVAVKGVARKGGTLRDREGRSYRYAREAVASGHSLLRIECRLDAAAHVTGPLAAVGHPPLGGAAVDVRTRRHFADRYGLDRAFVHVARVEASGLVGEAPLPADLALVAERLGFPGSTFHAHSM